MIFLAHITERRGVDRDGNVVARFEPTADMSKVEDGIKALL